MSYLVLARKWRPQVFDDLTGQETIGRILKNAIANNKTAHAYIFSGPRGVGKTTTARILAKALNCENGPTPEPCGKCSSCVGISTGSSVDVFEIDGASNTGVDNIRDLRERVRYAPSGGRYKVYIIDEAHMLSTSAFNALLKTLEEPPSHVIFVLATTEPKKIPPTVLSRCQHLPFKRISTQKIKERIKFISTAEGIKISDSALEMIARAAEGSMRDSLTILDQVASFSEDITPIEIKDLLGITDIETLYHLTLATIEGDSNKIINIISELTNSGADLKALTRDLLQFVRNLLIAKIAISTDGIIDLSEEESAAINRLQNKTTKEHIAIILSELIKAEPGIRSAFYPRISLEMTLIRLSLLSHLKSIDEALAIIKGQKTEDRKQKIENKNQKSEIQNTELKKQKLMDINDIWKAALKKIDDTNHPLYCKLIEGSHILSNNEIKIVFNGGLSVHAESIKENLPHIKKIISDISDADVEIKIETVKTKALSKKDLIEKAKNNPIIKEALELFEGRIENVIPIKKVNSPQS